MGYLSRNAFYAPTLFSALLAVIGAASAVADLTDASVVLTAGHWKVLRSVDSMTDVVSCTGVYGDEYRVQLTEDTLYVTVPGGVRGYRLRFDEGPPTEMQLASDIDKQVGAIGIKGMNLKQALAAKRLRMEILTQVQGLHSEDLDLTGIREAHANILSGCPVPEQGVTNVETVGRETSLCPRAVEERLRERGVAEEIIRYACAEK